MGDSLEMDVTGAQGVGMAAAWINRGKDELIEGIYPDYEIHSLTDLLKITFFMKT